MVLGPFQYPSTKIPLIKQVSLRVEMKDENAEQVMCLDAALPTVEGHEPVSSRSAHELTAPAPAPVASCGSASDHLKNVQVVLDPPAPAKGKNLTVTLSGDLDEDVASGVLSASLDLASTFPSRSRPRTGMATSLGPQGPADPKRKGQRQVDGAGALPRYRHACLIPG